MSPEFRDVVMYFVAFVVVCLVLDPGTIANSTPDHQKFQHNMPVKVAHRSNNLTFHVSV